MRSVLLALAFAVPCLQAQTLADVRVVDADGRAVTLDAIGEAMGEVDVVFLGELHDDSLGHVVEARVLEQAFERYSERRPVVLGLEMVETDVQTTLDEYLDGFIRERDWLAAGRPWANYETDYRPLVELARAHGAAVIGTNAPGRYVSLVARRNGPAVLDSLSDDAKGWLPPLPTAAPSEPLAAAFGELMGGMPHGHGPSPEGMLAAQTLRDASMAWQVAQALRQSPGALVVHVNGSFHSAGGLGIPEHLARYAPDARVLVVTMRRGTEAEPVAPGDDFGIVTPGDR